MSATADLRHQISPALAAFCNKPPREASTDLLATLGYRSDRTISLGKSSPQAFLDFLQGNARDSGFNEKKALFDDWKSIDLSHPIRNRLLRLTADSPDVLAVIKQEGRV